MSMSTNTREVLLNCGLAASRKNFVLVSPAGQKLAHHTAVSALKNLRTITAEHKKFNNRHIILKK